MNKQMTWKYIFQLKAIINGLNLYFAIDDQFASYLVKPLTNPEYSHLFLVLVFVIGIGYWWVGNDISRNQGIVKLGIIAQSSVFLVL